MKKRFTILVLLCALCVFAAANGEPARAQAQASKVEKSVTLRTLAVTVPQSGPPQVTAELGWEYDYPTAISGYRVYDRGDNSCQGARQLLHERTSPAPPSDVFPRQTSSTADDPIPLQFTLGSTHCVEIVALDLAGQEGTPLNFPFALAVPAVKNPRIVRYF